MTVSHTESPTPDAREAGAEATAPTVFRVPALALSGVALFLFGVTFPVVGAPALFGWLLVLPLLLGYWIIRVRTTVTAEQFVSRRAFRSTTVPWSSVTGLLFPRLGWGKATLEDGSSVRMPGVTVDKLPQLSAASGGAVPDPSPAVEKNVTDPDDEEPAEVESAEGDIGPRA